jgi:hypothetical protein
MVTLELKQLTCRNGLKLDYKTQLAELVRQVAPLDAQGAQKRGFSDGDMEAAEDLAAKIEASNGAVELTVEECMQLAEKVGVTQFPFSDPAFRELFADVKALKSK